MRTNIVLDSKLVKEAMKFAPVATKRALVDLALREYIRQHHRSDVRKLRGKGLIDSQYDYRSARRGK